MGIGIAFEEIRLIAQISSEGSHMNPCKNTKCPNYDIRYVNSCRTGDLFCLMVQETNRPGTQEDPEQGVRNRYKAPGIEPPENRSPLG
jgi:hypothetical protein